MKVENEHKDAKLHKISTNMKNSHKRLMNPVTGHMISPSSVFFTLKLSTVTASLKQTLDTGSDWIPKEQ